MSISSAKLARWYYQTAENLIAGIPLENSLRQAAGISLKLREQMADKLKKGDSWDTVLKSVPGWLPESDRYLLSASAENSRLPEGLNSLGELHEEAHRNKQQIILSSLYPLFILHLASLALPILNFINATEKDGLQVNFSGYSTSVISFLIPLWTVIVLLIVLWKLKPDVVKHFLSLFPWLRGYLKARSLYLWAFSLEAYYKAGSHLNVVFYGAGLVSGSYQLQKESLYISEAIQSGKSPGLLLQRSSVFPNEFAERYINGETTGQLDKALQDLSGLYRKKATRALTIASLVYPKVLFLIVAVYSGIKIALWYREYLNNILEML